MSKKSDRNLESLSADLAFKTGVAFYNQSLPFLNKVEPNKEGSEQRAFEHHAELIVSVTNLAFSIELLLKACWIASDALPKGTHDLYDLFIELPNQKIKNNIKSIYDQLCGQVGTETLGFDIALTLGEENEQERDEKAEKLDYDRQLEKVLKRIKDDFLFWRYFFEKGSKKEVKVFTYEFKYMQFIFIAIRGALLHKYDRLQ